MENNVNDLILFTDVFCRLGHELVDDLAEEINISSCVIPDTRYEVRDHAFVLRVR